MHILKVGDKMYNAITLKYDYDALEPYIDTRTVGIHYQNHYLKYVDNLNKILKEQGISKVDDLTELLKDIDQFDSNVQDDLIYNIGGVLNHELYFNNISPKKHNQPTGKLLQAIEEEFGSFEIWKQAFMQSASKLVGSGYTNLVLNKDKKLQIINTSNQDTVYLYGMIPIMTIDLWEHAYYLNYQSNRAEYIKNFFEIVDFDYIESQYEKNI